MNISALRLTYKIPSLDTSCHVSTDDANLVIMPG